MEKLIVNVETNETEIIALSAKEIAEINADMKKTDERLTNVATKVAEKATLLAKLGITEDEARLLLG